MGYDWKGWAVIFYLFSGAFTAFGLSDATSWGLTAVQYKWVLMVLGLVAGVGAKMGASWAGKSDSGSFVTPPKVLIPFVLATCLFSGCAKAPPTLSPEASKQYDATQIAVRVNRLMDAAIEAEANQSLPTATARIIVRFCVTADTTIAQYPAGYGPMVATAWKALKVDPLVAPLLMKNQYTATAATLVDLALAMWMVPAPEPMEALCSLSY
jgi:hypothetical protein